MLYLFLKAFGNVILKLFFKVNIYNNIEIPKHGPLIIAINHKSPMDPPLIGTVFPRVVHFFAAEELFSIPIVGWVIKKLGVIPVNRRQKDFRSLKRAIELLREGEIVAIFPQGGIPPYDSKERYKIKPGVAYLALKAKAPILCVCISGTEFIIPRGSMFFKKLFTRINVEYRAIIYPEGDMGVEDILEKVKKEIFACENTYSGR